MQQDGQRQRQPVLTMLVPWFMPAPLSQQRPRCPIQRTQAATRLLRGFRVRRQWAVLGKLLRRDDDGASWTR
ncbi:hypothetical protein GCM10009121_26350 [Rhodanobacter soli]